MNQVTVEKTAKYLIVKIPLKAVQKQTPPLRRQRSIGGAIAEGLADIEAGRVFGPFKNIREFKFSLKKLKA